MVLEIPKRTPTVRNLYLDGCRYLKPEKKTEKEGIGVTTERTPPTIDTSTTISEGVLGRVIVKDAGYIDIKDKTTYEIAKAYLKLFADKLKIEETSEEEG